MKNFKYLLVLVVCLLVLPLYVKAEVKPDVDFDYDSDKVPVYMFRGEGCPHCAEAEEWFESVKDQIKNKAELVGYETWHNEDNAKLMEQVGSVMKQDIEGVPFIIVGNKTWSGFSQDYASEILEEIDNVYKTKKDDRYDVMTYVKDLAKDKDSDKTDTGSIIAVIVMILVACGIGTGVYFARKNTK